jgi:SOS response regulatory protein OraA/RecX
VTVIFIKDAKSKGYLRIGIDDGEKKYSLTVSEAEYREAGSPLTRDALDRETLGMLITADMRYRAKIKSLNILAYGDNSERALRRKLSLAGFSADVIDEVCAEMLARGYINIDRQIKRLVKNEVALHHSGPLKIIPKLVAKGYSKSDVTRIISELEYEGEIDFEESKRLLLESKLKFTDDETEKKKLLYKNGYYVC